MATIIDIEFVEKLIKLGCGSYTESPITIIHITWGKNSSYQEANLAHILSNDKYNKK